MKGKMKRAVACLIAMPMMFSGLIMPQAAITAQSVTHISFDSSDDTKYEIQSGASLKDGRDNKALSSTNTSTSYATIDASAINAITGDFTFSIWCYPNDDTAWTRLYDIGTGTDKYIFLAPSSSFAVGYPRFVMKNGGAEQALTSSARLNLNEWNNVTVTRSGNLTSMYVNGILSGTTDSITLNPSDLGATANNYIIKSQYSADPFFNGMVDDFRVYDSALTASEVQELAAEAYENEIVKSTSEYDRYVIETNFYDNDNNKIFQLDSSASATPNETTYIKSFADNTVTVVSDTANANIIAAKYDNNGNLTNVSIKPTEISENNQLTTTFTPDKIFLWDNNFKPLDYLTNATLTASVDVKNYMTVSGAVTAKMYSYKGETQTELASTTEQVNLGVTDSKKIKLTSAMPRNCDYVKVVVTDSASGQKFDAGYIGASNAEFPEPVELYANPGNDPTYGAHDPSIFKDPQTGKYWAYSSHNLIFESEDLINWTKHDYTKTVTVPQTTSDFIKNNSVYNNTTVNGTYWAPDVIYVEGDDYPYWCYVSVSCGLGGRNSVISLLKCKSPGIWDGEYKDCGVVLASVENSSYKTNAIDSNIYTDTDGKRYFVWGSFWQGIQCAPLNADGTIKGIDCFATGAASDSNNAVMLSKSQNFGNAIMSVKSGVFGPEGPWMISNPDTGYRYLFTSYGWLGTNYNIRIARSSLDTSMENVISSGSTTEFLDQKGNQVGKAYSAGSKEELTGYKMIGSYKFDDGITYYGNGHNSVLNDNGDWYLVDHMRKVADAIAYLQVRKMLWTKSGWPVVSPVGYTGEKVQKLDKTMLYGTWDLASVGHTILKDGVTNIGSCSSRDADLPVESSEIVLMPNGRLAYDLGTWSFDGDHTVTITFTKDGDSSKNQYFKNGDVLEMYALVGYDEDDAAHTVVMTGIDQNTVTQFAKKSNANASDTRPIVQTPTATTVTKSVGGNPILGFDTNGNTMYAGDPAATVIGDTVYLYAGHDTATGNGYAMPEWVLYTSKDMTNWEYKGEVLKASEISWANDKTSAWASQMVEYNGKYYLYFCTWDNTDSGKQSIGVAVADKPEGPFVDIGHPLVKGSVTTPESSNWNDIDPTILIDTDSEGTEHRYLAWGNGKYYVCELNKDMISVTDKNADGTIDMNDIKQQKIKNLNGTVYTEAPWLYKRGDKYYTFFAANWREEMTYATASTPYGPWEYCGQLMPPTATSNTNHPAVIDFNGKTYFIYHNGALPNGSGYRRSVCVEELLFDENGNVLPLTETSTGIRGTSNVILANDGKYVAHNEFTNPSDDASYPISKPVVTLDKEDGYNSAWEIVKGKYSPETAEYVSIQSVNKPGLYIANVDGNVALTADDGTMAKNMTFKTVVGLNNSGISFESVSEPGKYLTKLGNSIILSYGRNANACTFTLGEVSPIPTPTAVPKPTPTPTPALTKDVDNNFDSLTAKTMLSVGTADQDPVTVDGLRMYIGTRGSGADATTNVAVETGGVTGNAIALNSGKFASASRGPRVELITPVIIDDSTVTAEFKAKLATSNAVLRYNDSTSSETGTVISGLSTTDWTTIKVEIDNTDGECVRKMWIGKNETPILTDAVETLPVLWGTVDNGTSAKVLLDDLKITTTVKPVE